MFGAFCCLCLVCGLCWYGLSLWLIVAGDFVGFDLVWCLNLGASWFWPGCYVADSGWVRGLCLWLIGGCAWWLACYVSRRSVCLGVFLVGVWMDLAGVWFWVGVYFLAWGAILLLPVALVVVWLDSSIVCLCVLGCSTGFCRRGFWIWCVEWWFVFGVVGLVYLTVGLRFV